MDIKKCYQLANRIINHRHKEVSFSIIDNPRENVVSSYDERKYEITMSKDFIENNHKLLIKDIILHEIAHSFGYSEHDSSFREKCEELGCLNKYTYLNNGI
jgi:predicted SprT family Zn-dependent metalloprotease